jgi:peroxiredoxin Q/BCP
MPFVDRSKGFVGDNIMAKNIMAKSAPAKKPAARKTVIKIPAPAGKPHRPIKHLQVGSLVPDFSMPATRIGEVSRAKLKGKPFVLYFYPKDDTSGCTAEAIAFTGLEAQFGAAGAAVIGISPDSASSHDKFKTKHKLGIALAADPERAAIDAYGVWKEKSMYGKKYFGVERSTFLIDREGRIAKIWRKVKVPGHAEEVLAAAKAL